MNPLDLKISCTNYERILEDIINQPPGSQLLIAYLQFNLVR